MNETLSAPVSPTYLTNQASTRPSAWKRVLATSDAWAPLPLRVALGVVMFPHGAQKLLGWWGGYGFDGTLGFLTGTIGLPWLLAVGVILIEFFAPLLLLAGVGTRAAAAGILAIMLGAIATVHAPFGFFMNW